MTERLVEHYLGDLCPGGHTDEHIVFIALTREGMDPDKARALITRLLAGRLSHQAESEPDT